MDLYLPHISQNQDPQNSAHSGVNGVKLEVQLVIHLLQTLSANVYSLFFSLQIRHSLEDEESIDNVNLSCVLKS